MLSPAANLCIRMCSFLQERAKFGLSLPIQTTHLSRHWIRLINHCKSLLRHIIIASFTSLLDNFCSSTTFFWSTSHNISLWSVLTMALPDKSRHSLIPGYLYSSAFSSPYGGGLLDLDVKNRPCLPSPSHSTRGIVIPAPNEKIQMHSPSFYAACTAGGIFSCGLTHMAVTPLDLVKCNMQVLHNLIIL